MATKDISWMPASGRHSVSIGASLGRALKARKGAPQTKKNNMIPDRDFYSFRYNFKPESIDSSKPGTIDIKRGKDSTSVTVERSSAQAGENHIFIGTELPAKEWECVLIYDEETGTFVLEKLDSFMHLNHEKKTAVNYNRPSTSPLPPLPSRPSTSRGSLEDLDLDAELEQNLDPDADGEPDDDFEDVIVQVPRREEEEEEEEEEIYIPSRAPSPKPKPKPQRPEKASAPAKSRAAPGKAKGKGKRELADSMDVEEESLEFGRPAEQTKRPRPLPPSEGLALPAGPSPLASPPPTQPAPASDSEEDWDEVPPVPLDDGDGDDDEEMMTAFEAEMNQTLELEEEEEDFLAAAVGSDPDAPPQGRPISLNQFAGGEPSQDEDDYSSSDESDEE